MRIDGDFEAGVVVTGKPAADVIDAHRNEDTAIGRGCGDRFEGQVVGTRDFVDLGVRFFSMPAAQCFTEGFFVDKYTGTSMRGVLRTKKLGGSNSENAEDE